MPQGISRNAPINYLYVVREKCVIRKDWLPSAKIQFVHVRCSDLNGQQFFFSSTDNSMHVKISIYSCVRYYWFRTFTHNKVDKLHAIPLQIE